MRKTLFVFAAAATLTACGGDVEESSDESPSSESASSSASRTSTAPRSTAPSTTTAPPTLQSPEDEVRLVTTVTAQTFTSNREALSTELVKSNSLVEAQTDFRFDEPTRTLVLAVTTVFDTGNSGVAYSLATDFAPVFWGPEVDSVRPESLVFFSVTTDGSSFVCDGPTMAALADRELSEEMFVQRCAA